jgi:PEP-CTERM motif
MPPRLPHRRFSKRRPLLALLAFLLWPQGGQASAGEVILYAASTDNTGGLNPISVPNTNNPNLPAIDPNVTLNPNPALLNGNKVGPLNGITYGPLTAGGDTGGTTGWVTSTYTIQTTGTYQLVWEVSNTTQSTGNSALATDNVLLGGKPLFNFQAGGLPVGLMGFGQSGANPSFGTSGGIAGLAPSGGDAAFAWIDTTGGLKPIYDTVDGLSAARLYSVSFSATAGMSLSIDAAFMTNDGGPADDYGIIALQSVPEPASLVLLAVGIIGLVAGVRWRRSLVDSTR